MAKMLQTAGRFPCAVQRALLACAYFGRHCTSISDRNSFIAPRFHPAQKCLAMVLPLRSNEAEVESEMCRSFSLSSSNLFLVFFVLFVRCAPAPESPASMAAAVDVVGCTMCARGFFSALWQSARGCWRPAHEQRVLDFSPRKLT